MSGDLDMLEPEYQNKYLKGLTPNVFKLGLVSLVADIASEMLYPIMPLFLSSVLGAPALAIGFIEGVAELVASLLKFYSGRWSDKTRQRKIWIIGGYLFSALGKSGIGLAMGWTWVLLCRVTDRFGKGIRTSPRDALLSDSVSSFHQGKAFGWHRGMDTLGAAIGPLFALLLISYFHGDLRRVFFLSIIPSGLSVLALFWVKEVRKVKPENQNSFRLSELPVSFWKFLGVLSLFSLVNSSDAFLILRFQKMENSLTPLILTYCGFNLIYALTSPWLGGLADRMGLRKCYFGGYFLFAVVYFLFGKATDLQTLICGFLLYGVYMAMTEGISKAIAVSLVPKHLKGSALGILGLTMGIASLFSSILAGAIWDYISPSSVFYLGAGGAVMAAVLFYTVVKFES